MFVFTLDVGGASGDETVYSRMLAPGFGIAEDPATGGASGPLGCYLADHRLLDATRLSQFVSLQGVAMRRPSRIHIGIDQDAARVTRVRVGGRSVLVGEGHIRFWYRPNLRGRRAARGPTRRTRREPPASIGRSLRWGSPDIRCGSKDLRLLSTGNSTESAVADRPTLAVPLVKQFGYSSAAPKEMLMIWSDLLVPGVPILEKIVRPLIVYASMLILIRVFGKRELAQLNPYDFIVLLMLSNTVQNAIIGNDNSISAA